MKDEVKNEIDIRKFTLQVHENELGRNGLGDNHVMAYFGDGRISPIAEFINNWETNAIIFSNQILKYLDRCETEEERIIVKERAKRAYNMLSKEHDNISILNRNVSNNPLMRMTHRYDAEEEERKNVMDNIAKAIKPKQIQEEGSQLCDCSLHITSFASKGKGIPSQPFRGFYTPTGHKF